MQRLRDQLIGRPNEARAIAIAKWYTFDALSYDNERQGLLAAFRKPMRAVPDLQTHASLCRWAQIFSVRNMGRCRLC